MKLRFIPVAVLLLSVAGSTVSAQTAAPKPRVQLDFQLADFTQPLQNLTPRDREAVDEAIRAIGQNQHLLALASLSRLSASNPTNSSLRVVRAYALLEIGNLSGALQEARSAEGAGVHSAYRCWFLAQVASVAGNKSLCRREMKHLAGSQYAADADKLGQQLARRSR